MTGTAVKTESRGLKSWFDREPLATLREEMDDLLARFFDSNASRNLTGAAVPPLELSETPSEVRVRLDVPGMKADNLNVELVGNTLTISGSRQEEKEEKKRNFHCVERRVGEFTRSVTLPGEVKESGVEARYKDGVLTVTMQKAESSRARTIEVKT